MKLSELTKRIRQAECKGDSDPDIKGLCFDSRKAGFGDLFFALKGEKYDGLDYVESAINSGSVAVVAETENPNSDYAVPWVKVPNGREAMSVMSDIFNNSPSEELTIIGVTGTNGKTTTSYMIHRLLDLGHRRSGLIGTIKYDLKSDNEIEATRTTPEAIDLQNYLSQMISNGCCSAVMEVSSHALSQCRTSHVYYDVGVFTNLSHDHLDYHGNMDRYFNAKKILFDQLSNNEVKNKAVAVINSDDDWGRKLVHYLSNKKVKTVTYGLANGADYRAVDLRLTKTSIEFAIEVGSRKFKSSIPLVGRFNIYNALAALASCAAVGLNVRETVNNLKQLPQIPGRLESVSSGRAFEVFVDYAHTPDALEKTLLSIKELDPRRIILVFGCGGERDLEKRAKMGDVASRFSNYSIITSDNPRSEDPMEIIKGIESGFGGSHYEILEDRREAIAKGVSYLAPGDVLLIAGKGHEDYQMVGKDRLEFDDRLVARQMLNDRDHVRHEMVRESRRLREEQEAERKNKFYDGEEVGRN